jgi:F-type H+-transporting ATPase subunit epsilon
MFLEIVTPDKKVFAGEIKLIQVPGSGGSFEVMQNHAPVISTLQKGKIKVLSPEGEKTIFPIFGGVIEVKDNKIIVLAEMTE